MNLLLFSSILLGLLAISYGQEYQIVEATDESVNKDITKQTDGTDVTLKCTFNISDAATKFINGDFAVNWFKEQSITDAPCRLQLNHGSAPAQDLADYLSFDQGLIPGGNHFFKSVTIKDARPEDSGRYTCELTLKDVQTPQSQLEYTVNVLDLNALEVFIYADDNVMNIPTRPNPDAWEAKETIELTEKPNVPGRPQEFAYVACVARGLAMSAMMTVTIENADDDELDRSIHGNMQYLEISNGTGDMTCRQKLEVVKVLEDRKFPVMKKDDGATLKCEAKVEDENNVVLKTVQASAILNLMTKPQFLNCSKEVYTPEDSKNFVISCGVKAKPMPTGEVVWYRDNVQINDDDQFIMNTKLQGDVFIAELTIVRPLENFNHLFKLEVTNSIGKSDTGILLKKGRGTNTGETSGTVVKLCSAILVLLLSSLAAILVQ